MRKGTLRDWRLPFWVSGLSLPLAALVAVGFLRGFTDAHAANRVRTVAFAGATSQRSGRYGTQRLPSNGVAFAYTGGSLIDFSIPWAVPCVPTQGGTGPPLLDRIQLADALPVKHGSFTTGGSYTFAPGRNQNASVLLTLKGAIHGSRASGTLDIAAQISWDRHLPQNPLSFTLPRVAECDTTKAIHWSAVATSQPTNLTFPQLARPQSRPEPLAFVMFVRTGTAPGASSIYYTWRDGPPSWRLVQTPPGGADSYPATAPLHPLVAFQRMAGGTTQIFAKQAYLGFNEDALPASGSYEPRTRVMQLTSFPAGADDPAVSPNGQEIAFSVGTGAECSIWLMDQFGHAQQQLTNQTPGIGCDDEPAWSPNGALIAFRRTQMLAAGPQITYMMVPVAGGAPQALNLPAAISGFTWAPGQKIVFISPAGPQGLPSLQTVNSDGSGDQTLLTARGLTGRPSWSPDGSAIAVTQRHRDGTTDIATVPATGGRVIDITDTPGASESAPVWAFPLALTSPGLVTTPLHVISRPTGRRRRHG